MSNDEKCATQYPSFQISSDKSSKTVIIVQELYCNNFVTKPNLMTLTRLGVCVEFMLVKRRF